MSAPSAFDLRVTYLDISQVIYPIWYNMVYNMVIDVLCVSWDYDEPLVTGSFKRRGIYVKHRRVSIGNIDVSNVEE